MTIIVYPALVTAAEGPSIRARFVDFAGIEVEAASAGELIRLARERLGAELQRLENEGDTWPEPTTVSSLSVPKGSSAVLVDVSVEDTPIRLTVSIGERLLKRIDEDAAARSMTRSGYLSLGARRMLGEAATGIGSETGRKIHEEIEAVGRRLNDALGPDSAVGRALADLDTYAMNGLRRLGEEVRTAIRARPASAPAAGKPQEEAGPQRAND